MILAQLADEQGMDHIAQELRAAEAAEARHLQHLRTPLLTAELAPSLDFWRRSLRLRFTNERCCQAIRSVFRETAKIHGLNLEELDRMLARILKPEAWRSLGG